MSNWGVTGSRDTVRIVRPGGIVAITLDARAAQLVYDGLKAIYEEDPERSAKLKLLRISDAKATLALGASRPVWWHRLAMWLRLVFQ